MSIGMSAHEYWDEDPMLARDYRKMDELRVSRQNQEMWLQGMYIYDAICCAAPLMRPFAKEGTKAREYPHEPYPLTEKELEEQKSREEAREMQAGIEKMKRIAADFNAKFKKERGDKNGG